MIESTHQSLNAEPLISIITITYNAAPHIKPTLSSIREQSFRNFEHLVIDGASTDNTLKLVSEMSPHSIVKSEPDKGLYDAMNKGLRQARGRFVLFLNAGDAFHAPDTLAKYAEAILESGFTPDIVYGDTVIVNSRREVTGPRHLSVPEKLTFQSFANGMLVCHQSFMVRRELAPEYNLNYRFSADYEWTLRCLRRSDPDKNVNLHCVVTDYLSDGLTDKNHKASLGERYRIMCENYGTVPTMLRHVYFALRNLKKKLGSH